MSAAPVEAPTPDVLALLVPVLGSSRRREYTFVDSTTGREFGIREVGSDQYHMHEMVPTGEVAEDAPGSDFIRCRAEPKLAAIEAAHGPNGFWAGCEQAGIDSEVVVQSGAGLSTNSRYLSSLRACADEIARCLLENVRYDATRNVPDGEKRQRVLRDRQDAKGYWEAEVARGEAAEQSSFGFLKGAYNLSGPIEDAHREAILAYANTPSWEGWVGVRGLLVAGTVTLWQAWARRDPSVLDAEGVFPSGSTIREAIRVAIEDRKNAAGDKLSEARSAIGFTRVR